MKMCFLFYNAAFTITGVCLITEKSVLLAGYPKLIFWIKTPSKAIYGLKEVLKTKQI